MSSEPLKLDRGDGAIGDGSNGVPAHVDPERGVEQKFTRLRDEWKSQRGHESSTTRLILHPAYQKIIGMGPAVVPLLLRELEREVDAWFWALMAITEADPVPAEHRGDGPAMARDWLDWAKGHGYKW